MPYARAVSLVLSGATRAAPDVVIIGSWDCGLDDGARSSSRRYDRGHRDVASVFGGRAVVSEGGLVPAGTPLQQRLSVKHPLRLAYRDIMRLGRDSNSAWARPLPIAAERHIRLDDPTRCDV